MEQIKKINAPSLSRNPRIMYILEQMDLVEQRGLGFQTIKELSETNLPLPFVSFDNPYIVFRFPREVEVFNQLIGNNELNSDELKGFDYIRSIQKITRKEYETHFGYDKKKAVRHLTHMTELGLIEQKGAGPGVYYEAN